MQLEMCSFKIFSMIDTFFKFLDNIVERNKNKLKTLIEWRESNKTKQHVHFLNI